MNEGRDVAVASSSEDLVGFSESQSNSWRDQIVEASLEGRLVGRDVPLREVKGDAGQPHQSVNVKDVYDGGETKVVLESVHEVGG